MNAQKTTLTSLFFLLFAISFQVTAQQNIVSYAYDNAGNRISRKVITLNGPNLVKKAVNPTPVEEQLGERKISIYPNPTKGALAVEITGGDEKDQLRLVLYNVDGKQLLNKVVQAGTTPVNMANYPVAYYILRVQAGDKYTEYKIVKQ
jgi:hypothetical protein